MSTILRKAVTRIILDVASPDVQKAVSVTQGDVNRKFEITLVDGGRPFPLQPKWTAALVGIKPDGKNLFNSCVVDETGKIVYDFAGGEEIATAAGGYAIYFEIYDEVGDTLASPSIWLTVIPFPSRDMASEDQYTAAREIIRRLNEAEGHIETIEGDIDDIQERLDEKDRQVAEIFARMTRVALVTIPKSEWTDGDPIQAKVKLPDVEGNSVAFLIPADDTTRMTASAAGLTPTISTLDKEGDTIFVSRGESVPVHDMNFLCFVLRGESEEETEPTASFVGISAGGGGGGGSTPIANDLVTNSAVWALSAAMGVELNQKKVNVTDIVDNLLTPDSKKPLSANQGVVLKKMIDDTAMTFTTAVPLAWTEDTANGGYTQTVAVEGILATDNPIADIVLGADVDASALYLEAWACVTRITTADGAITLYANEGAPETAFTVQLKVVR